VAWSQDESRLASCDKMGVVVVWDAVPAEAAGSASAGQQAAAAGGGA
jgi:hypothetical protein